MKEFKKMLSAIAVLFLCMAASFSCSGGGGLQSELSDEDIAKYSVFFKIQIDGGEWNDLWTSNGYARGNKIPAYIGDFAMSQIAAYLAEFRTKGIAGSIGNYYFDSWTTDKEGNNPWNFDLNNIDDSDVSLYVRVSSMPTLSFDKNDSLAKGEMESVQKTPNKPFVLPANNFTKTGYTFKNWNKESSGSGASFADGAVYVMGSNSETLYAQWQPNSYTVVFDANGGTGSMDPQAMTYDQSAALNKNLFVKEDGAFNNWKEESTGKVFSDEESVLNLTDVKDGTVYLTAQWIPYPILSFDGNGADSGSVDSMMQKDEPLTVPANGFARKGYTFKEWNTKADGTGTSYSSGSSLTITEDTTLYAVWETVTYHALFYMNCSPSENPIKDQTFTITELASGRGAGYFWNGDIPARADYEFAGWYWDRECLAPASSVTADNLPADPGTAINFYAKWTDTVTVFFLDSVDSGTLADPASGLEKGSYVPQPADPSRTGYSFTGWFTEREEGSQWNFDTDKVFETRNLYAHWTANSYTVVFDANGGTGSMDSQTMTYDTPANLNVMSGLSNVSLGKTVFDKWNTKADGSGTDYEDGSEVINLASGNTGDESVTLYAKWREPKIFYHIELDYTYDPEHPDQALEKAHFLSRYDNTGISEWYKYTADQTGIEAGISYAAGGDASAGYDSTLLDNLIPVTRTPFENGIIPAFRAWNTSRDLDGDSYRRGETFQMPAEDMHLYIEWTVNGGTGPSNGFLFCLTEDTGSGGAHGTVYEVAPKINFGEIPGYNWNDANNYAENYETPLLFTEYLDYYDIGEWRLPTQDEIYFIYRNVYGKDLGDFEDTQYWTSTSPEGYDDRHLSLRFRRDDHGNLYTRDEPDEFKRIMDPLGTNDSYVSGYMRPVRTLTKKQQ